MKNDNLKQELYNSLRMLAPGTELRLGIDNIVRSKTGALIVIGNEEDVLKIIDGGFIIDKDYTPYYIYELAKMDGAVIISSDCKKILYANVQLLPDQNIFSQETGIRHRTAERVSKQTKTLVVAVSQRRNIITLYKGNIKYVLRDTNQVLNKANQAIQVLEKYKAVFNQAINNLTILEFEDLVTVYDVAKIIQKVEMIERIEEEIERYILELGNEGRLITMQMEEIMSNVKEDKMNIIKDYWYHNQEKSYQKINEEIMNLSSEELLNLSNIARIFGYDNDNNSLDVNIYPKGYRILNKIPRISSGVLENVIKMFGSLQRILKASVSELDLAEGVGEIRAKIIKEGLKRYQDQVFIERHII